MVAPDNKAIESDPAYQDRNQERTLMRKYRVLLLSTFIVAGSSIVYELLISASQTYLMGNSTFYYAIVIGTYMASLGVGAFISRFVKKHLIRAFALVEIILAIIGGVSTLAIFEAFLHLPSQLFVMFFFVISIGILGGLEIPLLTRIIEEDNPDGSRLRLTLSAVMCLDYIGGLVGSVAFPLLLLPQMGYYATAFLAGIVNLTAAVMVTLKYRDSLGRSSFLTLSSICAVIGVFLFVGIIFSQAIANSVEDGLYRDQIVYDEQTQYQHIVMTKHKDDTRLFLDGNLQFSSSDERRYHEALVHIPMAAASSHGNVLILGGGDGLAAREILKYDDVGHITLVDLDPEMTRLCSEDETISKLNQDSLKDPKMEIVNEDAYMFLQETSQMFDVVIVDLPDPNSDVLAKLYSNVFYRLCSNVLSENGAMSVQSTSPYSARKTFWCVNATMSSEKLNVYPYHVHVPSFGDWGFNLAAKNEIPIDELQVPEDMNTDFLDTRTLQGLFAFPKDSNEEIDVEINTMSKPVIMDYYNYAVSNWR